LVIFFFFVLLCFSCFLWWLGGFLCSFGLVFVGCCLKRRIMFFLCAVFWCVFFLFFFVLLFYGCGWVVDLWVYFVVD